MTGERDSPYVVGIPVDGTALFFGRGEETATFFRRIHKTPLQPFEVRGLRRSGKTSFLRHVAAFDSRRKHLSRAALAGTAVAYVNLQRAVKKPEDFFTVVGQSIADACPGIGTVRQLGPLDPYRKFERLLTTVLSNGAEGRLVVLLDEFEIVGHSPAFDADFFEFLRSCMDGRFAWIPSSYRGVGALSERDGTASKFSNVYNNAGTIVIGPLEDSDASNLVSTPAASRGIKLKPASIRRVSGDLPSFLQAVAERWFIRKTTPGQKSNLRSDVLRDLLQDGELIERVIRGYWKDMTPKERTCLHNAALGAAGAQNAEASRLEEYGLLRRNGRSYSISSELVAEWLVLHSETEPIERRSRVFICYARKDNTNRDLSKRWLERLLEHVEPLLGDQLAVWSDESIETGDEWRTEIDQNLKCSKAAVLLVSSAFLASSFIRNTELPSLLDLHRRNQLKIFPLILSPSVAEEVVLRFPDPVTGPHWCKLTDFHNTPSGSTLASLDYDEQEAVLATLAITLKQHV